MHVLIATTGALDPERAVAFTERLVAGDGRVTIMTVVEIPRSFLDTLELDAIGRPNAPRPDEHRRYLEERGRRATGGLANAFLAAGIPTDVRYVEGKDPSEHIARAAAELDADMIVVGATRSIFDRSAWESVSARLMLATDRPILVVPAPVREPQEARS